MMLSTRSGTIFSFAPQLFHACLIGLPYDLVAIALLVALHGLDRLAAFALWPYVLYLFYANAFGFQVWKLNR